MNNKCINVIRWCSDALDKLSKCGTPHALPDALKNSWGEHCFMLSSRFSKLIAHTFKSDIVVMCISI